MYPSPLARTALALTASALAVTSAAQQPLRKYPEPRIRFDGVVQVGAADARKLVQVDLRTWILAPGLKAERLALPADASIIIELHAGKLETLMGDKREQRKPGAIWLVSPGASIAFTTEDDSVTLTTLALRPH